MRLNIAHKIFGIALSVLLMMAAVAAYSIQLTARIADDLDNVVSHYLPLSEAIARINVRILEKDALIQRLMLYAEGGVIPTHAKQRFNQLTELIHQDFYVTRSALVTLKTLPRARLKTQKMLDELDAIERDYLEFVTKGTALLDDGQGVAIADFEARFLIVNQQQDRLGRALPRLRRQIETQTDKLVVMADLDQKALLQANISLTLLASVLGLSFAFLITRLLVAAIRRLVVGAQAVQAGQLDTYVEVKSNDELGQLTQTFNMMTSELRVKERIKETFGTYMDPRIVSGLIDNCDISEPGGKRREMTVLFVDLKGFTTISEQLEADKLIELMNGFYSHMTDAISSHQGVIDKFIGDAVMAFWGPPFTSPTEHARLATQAALQAGRALKVWQLEVAQLIGETSPPLDIDLRIGISTGEMVVGTVGSRASKSYTVMGDAVNLGSRLEAVNKYYGTRIILSERTAELVGDALPTREIDQIRVKGKQQPSRIFELGDQPWPLALRAKFESGIQAYRLANWRQAESDFKDVLAQAPDDSVAATYRSRIEKLKEYTPDSWDGIWASESK